MDKLRIAEIFTSIQGEGGWVGIPSTFVRVSGCNLRCRWCDTPYASWHPEGPVLSIEEIIDRVHEAKVRHIVLTGGEPMLFESSETLCAELRSRGHIVTIETAGTVFREIECDLMSISPKLSNSTPGADSGEWPERHERTRLDRGPLAQLIARYQHQIKFVVDPEHGLLEQIAEIDTLLAAIPEVDPARVLLMAEGTDAETLHRRERMLVSLCIERGWRMTPRLHVDLFGNTKGT